MVRLKFSKTAEYLFSGASSAKVALFPPDRISSPGTPWTSLCTHLTVLTGAA